jgi:organic hydroperoxide reductase OsmC/OhrA
VAYTDAPEKQIDHDWGMSTRTKSFDFPVSLQWAGGKRVRAYVGDKQMIEIATPPEFKGDSPGTWSPEDFLVAAAASCYAVTFVAIAKRRDVPFYDLALEAVGRIGPREDGSLGFLAIELAVELETDGGQIEAAREVAEHAERGCLVSQALGIPVEVELNVSVVDFAAPALI